MANGVIKCRRLDNFRKRVLNIRATRKPARYSRDTARARAAGGERSYKAYPKFGNYKHTGVIYAIVSIADPKLIYVGRTTNQYTV